MIFSATAIPDAKIIDIEELRDQRGFFARTWCERELAAQGLVTDIAQESLSYSRSKGTMRGLHYQRPPHGEVKIVRCIRGAIYDVIVDIRPNSPSFLRSVGVELTALNRRALYVPNGCVHGFLTRADDTEVAYLISTFYVPAASAGYRHDDPAFAIAWPAPIEVINEKDTKWPDFKADPALALFSSGAGAPA